MGSGEGMWVVAGDFNSVRLCSERRNSKFISLATRDFNAFIDEANLHEFTLKGRRFTFVAGNKMSRIDRIFVNWSYFMKWPSAEYRALSRDKSDHSPLRWVGRGREEGVGCGSLLGVPDVKLLNKFRKLRKVIGEWNSECIDKELEEKRGLEEELHHLDLVLDSRELTKEEFWVLGEIKKRLRELDVLKQKDVRQKPRTRWAMDGDDNTKFFHGMINKRRSATFIPGMLVGGVWETKPTVVKREVLGFFHRKFIETMKSRPYLSCYGLKRLSTDEA
ncbi:uncharacterized protein LOC110927977 [Helianthus annuus]|uniref:uncharacterized protein LOC110927977 n=1 Tax=Helianthus annuus TaxID=4232 RepID=UPI000B906526|nr:uncharacterized protein LOC110927977 [Helianthus annuus]